MVSCDTCGCAIDTLTDKFHLILATNKRLCEKCFENNNKNKKAIEEDEEALEPDTSTLPELSIVEDAKSKLTKNIGEEELILEDNQEKETKKRKRLPENEKTASTTSTTTPTAPLAKKSKPTTKAEKLEKAFNKPKKEVECRDCESKIFLGFPSHPDTIAYELSKFCFECYKATYICEYCEKVIPFVDYKATKARFDDEDKPNLPRICNSCFDEEQEEEKQKNKKGSSKKSKMPIEKDKPKVDVDKKKSKDSIVDLTKSKKKADDPKITTTTTNTSSKKKSNAKDLFEDLKKTKAMIQGSITSVHGDKYIEDFSKFFKDEIESRLKSEIKRIKHFFERKSEFQKIHNLSVTLQIPSSLRSMPIGIELALITPLLQHLDANFNFPHMQVGKQDGSDNDIRRQLCQSYCVTFELFQEITSRIMGDVTIFGHTALNCDERISTRDIYNISFDFNSTCIDILIPDSKSERAKEVSQSDSDEEEDDGVRDNHFDDNE